MLQQLKEIYETYIANLSKAYKEAKPTDGLFGWGDDPRKDPCHMRFYEDAERWAEAFLAARPENEEVYEAVRFLLETPDKYREKHCFWFMFAAQGLTRDMIGLLTKEQCGKLLAYYEETYPRRERMPVQKDVCKKLKKGAK